MNRHVLSVLCMVFLGGFWLINASPVIGIDKYTTKSLDNYTQLGESSKVCNSAGTATEWPKLPTVEEAKLREILASRSLSANHIFGADGWALMWQSTPTRVPALEPAIAPAETDHAEERFYFGRWNVSTGWQIVDQNSPVAHAWLREIDKAQLPGNMSAFIRSTFADIAPVQTMAAASAYYLPYEKGRTFYVSRAGGDHGNAIDFAMRVGPPILAIEAGTITKIVESNTSCGCDSSYIKYNNIVEIKHDDGSRSVYAHLATNSVPDTVKVGHRVGRGTLLAFSGQSGYTCNGLGGCGPHLHLDVFNSSGQKINPRFEDIQGYVLSKRSYTSGNTLFTPSPPTPPGENPGTPSGLTPRVFAGDFTGNGKDEVAVFYPATGDWYVGTSSGSFFFPYLRWASGHGVGSYSQRVGDVNGDGKDDSIVFFRDTCRIR